MNTLFEYMKIPKSCEAGNTVFKKLFYDNADLSKADRDILTDQVDKVIWQYTFKPETINIKPYLDEIREYNEIEILEVKLNSEVKTKRLAEIVMRTIPYPMLLVFSIDNRIQLYTAHQRTNLADQSRNTIEEFIFTDWIDAESLTEKDRKLFESLEIKNLSYQDYYRFYSDIVDRLVIYNASKLIDGYIEGKSATEVKVIYDKIAGVEKEIEVLRASMKKETQINRRVEMNVEIKKLENKKSNQMQELE